MKSWFKTFLEQEAIDTPFFRVLINAMSADVITHHDLDMIYTCYDSNPERQLSCCSGQYVNVRVSINDVMQYLSENEMLLFHAPDSSVTYNNLDDASKDPQFSHFEYWANYQHLNLSRKFASTLGDYCEHDIQMILFSQENQTGSLPHFIRDYAQITTVPKLHVKLPSMSGQYATFSHESSVLSGYEHPNTVIFKLANVPYEYYSTHEIQPCSLHYNFSLQKFVSSCKESPQIERQIQDVHAHGLLTPLVIKINRYGVITKLVNCNTRYICARYLQLPYIPAVIMYDGTKDITDHLSGYDAKCERASKLAHQLYPDLMHAISMRV